MSYHNANNQVPQQHYNLDTIVFRHDSRIRPCDATVHHSFCAYYDNDFLLLSSSFYNYFHSLDFEILLLVWGLHGDLPRGGIQRATLFALAMDITICPMSTT
jgi:hypothetical protein